jgi:predicted RNA-binding protein YlxR (DUF448 family)
LDERGPLRRCVVTRERREKARMIRFVVGPDRTVVPDLGGRLPGRGMWLSARGDVLETERLRGAFARAARAPVAVAPDLKAIVAAGLARRIAELLGLARRAGQAVGGFEKAREWLASGRVGVIVQAEDGSRDERARLLGGWAEVPVVTALSAAALGAVFGRDHLVHVAVAPGRLCDAICVEAERLAGVAGSGSESETGFMRPRPPRRTADRQLRRAERNTVRAGK